MGLKAYRFVGLNADVYLPDDIQVIIDIVPDRFIGWVRSGQKFTGQTKTTFHDTGAPGQNARSQRNYLHNGPSENGQRRLVGFNFAIDDKVLYQLTPLDEVTWAAGTPDGNRYGWHVEMCFGGNINFDQSLRNAIALHAGLIAAKGWKASANLAKHQDWSGKWCPAQVLNRGLWPSVVSRVDAAARAIAGGGGQEPPAQQYAAPDPITELASEPVYIKLANGAELIRADWKVRATKSTPRRRWADKNSPSIGPDIEAGLEFTTSYLVINPDGSRYLYTPWHTRVDFRDVDVIGAA